jgi:hypothetical protein
MEQPLIVHNLDGGTTEYTEIPLVSGLLEQLFRELFQDHWPRIVFGPCIQGAVFEIRLVEPPKKIAMLDGYLTVDTGPWHLHLCIDEHRNAPSPEISKQRQAARAAFFHDSRPHGCVPGSWGLRLWNGLGEQMITVFFPNPYLTDQQQLQKKPEWSRLALWEQFRQKYTQGQALA